LLDFKTSDISELQENFWYVILAADFKGAVIRRQGQEDVKLYFRRN